MKISMFTQLVGLFLASELPHNAALDRHPECSVAPSDKMTWKLCLHNSELRLKYSNIQKVKNLNVDMQQSFKKNSIPAQNMDSDIVHVLNFSDTAVFFLQILPIIVLILCFHSLDIKIY
jgi:hypothetical protein